MMELRHLIGYGLLAVLVGTVACLWLRRHLAVRRDRLMRWGTTDSPRQARRRNQR